jgi:Fic family protein
MPSTRYTRIEITQEAYMGLEAEAVLQGKTLKKLASDLILKGISAKALKFVQLSSQSLREDEAVLLREAEAHEIGGYRSRISEDADAIQRIKDLWSQNPRPSRREIARIIDYPASTTKYQIKNMLERGELIE